MASLLVSRNPSTCRVKGQCQKRDFTLRLSPNVCVSLNAMLDALRAKVIATFGIQKGSAELHIKLVAKDSAFVTATVKKDKGGAEKAD